MRNGRCLATLQVTVPARSGKPRRDYINHFRQDRPLEGVYFTDFAFDCDIFTNSVTEEFLDDFIVYLESRGLRHNTIAGYIQKIQSLVRKASQYNYAVDATYDGTDLREEPVNAVFLSMNEIARIYYYKFERQDRRKARERIRDLFVIGCLTAQFERWIHHKKDKEDQCGRQGPGS